MLRADPELATLVADVNQGHVFTVAIAGQAPGVVLDATGAIGDLQTGDLYVAGIRQVDDHVAALGAPQFWRAAASGGPSGAQDARGV